MEMACISIRNEQSRDKYLKIMDKFIKGAVFFLFMLSLILPIKAYNSDDVFFFVVPKGYTMTTLSNILSVSQDVLYKYNPNLREGLGAGMQIYLPASTVSEENLKKVDAAPTFVGGALNSLCENDNVKDDGQSGAQNDSTYNTPAVGSLLYRHRSDIRLGFKPNPLFPTTTLGRFNVNSSTSQIAEDSPNGYNCSDKGDLRALVIRNEKIGFVNEHGIEVIPLVYDDATNFYNGHACVRKDRQYYLIDGNGNVVRDLNEALPVDHLGYLSYNPLNGSVYISLNKALFNNDPYEEYITWDNLGNVQKIHVDLPHGAIWCPNSNLLSDDVRYFKNKKIVKGASSTKSKSGLDDETAIFSNAIYDLKGNLFFTTPDNEDLQPFSCGLARIKTFRKRSAAKQDTIYNVRYEFVDLKGVKLPACSYDYAEDFSDSLACVHKNGKAGYIDVTGKIVIPLIFDGEKTRTVGKFYKDHSYTNSVWNRYGDLGEYKIGQFKDGLAIQTANRNHVVIDKTGEIVDSLSEFKGHTFPIKFFNNGIIVFDFDPVYINPQDNRVIDHVIENSYCAYNIKCKYIVRSGKYDFIGPFINVNNH